MRLRKLFFFIICIFLAPGAAPAGAEELEEASGITRAGDELLIVGDDNAGVYFKFPLKDVKGPLIEIDPEKVTRVELPEGRLALDLESIEVLADGRVVVLSERLRGLVGAKGLIADYDNPFNEFANHGLEGLAVRPLSKGKSKVAVLWEGGVPKRKNMPREIAEGLGDFHLNPVVLVHAIPKMGSLDKAVDAKPVSLKVPEIVEDDGAVHRFRAPDLVWHEWDQDGDGDKEWGFIVLISSRSLNSKPQYKFRYLLRFTLDGEPYGEVLNLDWKGLPDKLKRANWEGLGWFEKGKSLVLIHDRPPKGNPTAFLVKLPKGW